MCKSRAGTPTYSMFDNLKEGTQLMLIYTTFVTASQLISPVNGHKCRRITKQNIKQFGFESIEKLHEQYPDFPLMCEEYKSTRINGSKSKKFKDSMLREKEKFGQKKILEKENYSKNPNLCHKCENAILYEKRNNKFCSRSCGNGRKHSEETKNKIRKGVKLNPGGVIVMSKEELLKCNSTRRIPRITKKCKTCNSIFQIKKTENKDYCSGKCNPNRGGYRKGSGRSYGGYYKGIYCHSTYELVWVMFNIHHQKDFSVCKEIFNYVDENGTKRRYFPDFVQDDVIIEIKGYFTETVEIKRKSVLEEGRKIKILYKNDLKVMFDWFNKNYKGIKLYEMFE